MKTIYNGSGATVTLYWKIMRGENKVTEDLSNLKSKVFLIGSCNTYSMEPDVVTDEEFGNKVLKVEVDASMLSTGVYDVKAMWEKNDGRNIMKSARTGVFSITDNSEEVGENKGEEVIRIASYVESIGRDGLSAYEIAVIRGLNNGLSENDWVGNEAGRIEAEQERESAETTRKENETARENAESSRQSRFNTFMTESAAAFSDAQTNRDTAFTQAQEDRETAFTDRIADFETRFNEAETNRNNGEGRRNQSYAEAEDKRDADYATAEANRDKKYNQAEEERDSTIQEKLDDIEERYTTAEAARRNLFTEAETERDAKEDDRAAAEDARQSRYNEFMSGIERTYDLSEEARQKAFEENEEKREKNEQIREESEAARIETFSENEGTYDSYDDSRWGKFNVNEAQRDYQEQQRANEEETRQSNEATRIASENERRQKEAEREANEAIRQESYLDKLPVSAVVQETGDSADLVMSQKAVSEKLTELESNIGYRQTINFDSAYSQVALDHHIPRGRLVLLSNESISLNGRTNSNDEDYVVIKNGTITDRDVRYVKSLDYSGTVTIIDSVADIVVEHDRLFTEINNSIRELIYDVEEEQSVSFSGQYLQQRIDTTIPRGAVIRLSGDIKEINGRTNSGDSEYQTITSGTIADRDINYVKNKNEAGTVIIGYTLQGLGNVSLSLHELGNQLEDKTQALRTRVETKEVPSEEYREGYYNVKLTNINVGDEIEEVTVVSNNTFKCVAVDVKEGAKVLSKGMNGSSVKTWMFVGYDNVVKAIQPSDGFVGNTTVTNEFIAPCDGTYYFSTLTASSGSYYLIRDINILGVGEQIQELYERVDELSQHSLIDSNEALISSLGSNSIIKEQDELNQNELIQLTSFPHDSKFGDVITFRGNIDIFNSLLIGKGINGTSVYNAWVKIDNDNVCLFKGDKSTAYSTQAHSLNITSFLYVSLIVQSDGVLKVLMNTLNGKVVLDLNKFGTSITGTWGVSSEDSLFKNCKLSAINESLKNPFWILGASYEGFSESRWPYYLADFNIDITKIFWNAYPGRDSAACYADFERCLKLAAPKYVYWTMWGNGSADSLDYYINKVNEYCKSKGAILIIIDRPNSVNASDYDKKKEVISKYISQGVRYVDAVRALSFASDDKEGWYDGYQDSDGKHTTSLGAKALAYQVVLDVPEIAQYW